VLHPLFLSPQPAVSHIAGVEANGKGEFCAGEKGKLRLVRKAG
jgi:hypothetical protein